MEEIEDFKQILREIKLKLRKMDLKKLDIQLTNIINNNIEVEDALDWISNVVNNNQSNDTILDNFIEIIGNYSGMLIFCLSSEKYELCAKLKIVLDLEYQEITRVIRARKKTQIGDTEDLEEQVHMIWGTNGDYITEITKIIYE
jgi:hypothetical protein